MTAVPTSWRVDARDGRIRWWDLACGACPSCHAGLPGRCATPVDPGTVDADRIHDLAAGAVAAAIVEAAAIGLDLALGAPSGPGVLLSGSGPRLVEIGHLMEAAGARPLVLHGDVPPGTALPVAEGDDVRATFGHLRPSRRPDVVLTLDGDLATASRLVRRGGAIGTLGPVTQPPPFAAVVQRELTVLAPRDPSAAARLLRFDDIVRELESVV